MCIYFFCWQVSSIEQEILSLINRVSHPNLTHYLAVNVQESAPTVNVQVMSSRYTVILNFLYPFTASLDGQGELSSKI